MVDFYKMTVRQLRDYCVEHNIPGYSKYVKAGKNSLLERLKSLSYIHQDKSECIHRWVKKGFTSAGYQRWICKKCKATRTDGNNRRGRKPLFDKPMSRAEINRRHYQKRKSRNEVD